MPALPKVAKVMLGEPPQDYKTFIQQVGTSTVMENGVLLTEEPLDRWGFSEILITEKHWKAVGFKLIHMRTVHRIVSRAPFVPRKAGKNQALLKEKKEAAEAELARKKAWCILAELHHAAPTKWCGNVMSVMFPKFRAPTVDICKLWQIYWQFLKRNKRRDLGWCQFSAGGVVNSWVSWSGGSCAEKGARGTEESARDLQKTLTLSERQYVCRILQVYNRSQRQAHVHLFADHYWTTTIRLQILSSGHYLFVGSMPICCWSSHFPFLFASISTMVKSHRWVDGGSKLDTPTF